MSSFPAQTPSRRPSLLGGSMIIAGAAVSTGMFSLPIAMSGIWFGQSATVLLLTRFCMLLSGTMIFEANLDYPVGSSFSAITRDLLSQNRGVVNRLSIALVLYILTYAYISGGDSIIDYAPLSGLGVTLPEKPTRLLSTLAVMLVVWWSTHAVDYITTLMLGGMIITFDLSISGLFGYIQPAILFSSDESDAVYWPHLLAALPFYPTSLGYHGNMPSLMKYYDRNPQRVGCSLRIGTLIALAICLLWQVNTLGIIPRKQFKGIIVGGSSVGTLVEYLHWITAPDSLNVLLITFSDLVVTSSFLGATSGLFDYLADLCRFDDSHSGRFKAALLTLVPPTIGGLLFLSGFVYVIDFAGLAAAFWVVIVLALMARASRRRFGSPLFHARGGIPAIMSVLLSGVANTIVHVLTSLHRLPECR